MLSFSSSLFFTSRVAEKRKKQFYSSLESHFSPSVDLSLSQLQPSFSRDATVLANSIECWFVCLFFSRPSNSDTAPSSGE